MKHDYAAAFLGVAFFFGAAFLAAGFAVVLVTRPDLVLPITLGWSTTAGACVHSQHTGSRQRGRTEGTYSSGGLARLRRVGLGLRGRLLGGGGLLGRWLRGRGLLSRSLLGGRLGSGGLLEHD